MKIFNTTQIHELDKYTIEHEPIRSIDLMERAAKAVTQVITKEWDQTTPVVVFAGPGNNGGDALAVARLLAEQGYQVSVYLFNIHDKLSEDCAANKKRLAESKRLKEFVEVSRDFDRFELGVGHNRHYADVGAVRHVGTASRRTGVRHRIRFVQRPCGEEAPRQGKARFEQRLQHLQRSVYRQGEQKTAFQKDIRIESDEALLRYAIRPVLR